jgi:hypothetical protein
VTALQVEDLQNPAPADVVQRAKLGLDGCEGTVVMVVYDTVGARGCVVMWMLVLWLWCAAQAAPLLYRSSCLCIQRCSFAWC